MSTPSSGPAWVVFEHHQRTAAGTAGEVIEALQARLSADPHAIPVVLDAETSDRVEMDWRQPREALLALLPAPAPDSVPANAAPRGPGRPRLGVTAREVTLLPRHWEWLARQPGGASVALRKLVQAAMREGGAAEARRKATDAAYRFMSIVAGDLPNYEEASRALFAGDIAALQARVTGWPTDVANHLLMLAARIDAAQPDN